MSALPSYYLDRSERYAYPVSIMALVTSLRWSFAIGVREKR